MKKRMEVAMVKAKTAKVKVTEATEDFERKNGEARKAAVMSQPLEGPNLIIRCEKPVEGDRRAKKTTEKANRMSPAPKVLRKLSLFSGVSGMAVKSAPAPIAAAKEENQVTVSSATGGLHFYRANHDEAKCDFCKALKNDSKSELEHCHLKIKLVTNSVLLIGLEPMEMSISNQHSSTRDYGRSRILDHGACQRN